MLHSSNWAHLHFGNQTWQWNPHHFRIYFHSNLFNYTSGTPFWTLNFHRGWDHVVLIRGRSAQVELPRFWMISRFSMRIHGIWWSCSVFFWGFVSRCDKLWKTKGAGHGGQSFLIYIQSFLWWRGVFLNSWGFAKWQDSSLNLDLHGSWSELWGPASEKKKTFQSSCKRRGRGSHGWALNSRATPRNSNRTYLDHPRPSINGTFTVSFIYSFSWVLGDLGLRWFWGVPNGLAIWPTTPPRGKEAARGGSHGDWVTQPAMDGFDGLFMWIRQ